MVFLNISDAITRNATSDLVREVVEEMEFLRNCTILVIVKLKRSGWVEWMFC